MDVHERFGELVAGPESAIPLDEAALLIAAADHPVDVAAELDALDALADGFADAATDPRSLAGALFVDGGFAGNALDYGDPRNSYLDEVRRRRLGIPITLSVVMIEVGRRLGIPLVGIGMPGHFLVGVGVGPGVGGGAGAGGHGGVHDGGVYFDPFHGGDCFDHAGARARFERLHPGAPFVDRYLEPVGTRAVLARMLANLVTAHLARDPLRAVAPLRLRLGLPDLAPADRRQTEAALVRLRARMN